MRDECGAHIAAGARPVFDHDCLPQRLGKPLADQAGQDVGGAAGAEGNDHADRARRPVLRLRQSRSEQRKARNQDRQPFHQFSSHFV
jgi:hypothetical protein